MGLNTAARHNRRQFLSVGLPIVAVIVIAYGYLSRFQASSYNIKDKTSLTGRRLSKDELLLQEVMLKQQAQDKREFNLEHEYERMMVDIDHGNWEQKRGPRLEEPATMPDRSLMTLAQLTALRKEQDAKVNQPIDVEEIRRKAHNIDL